MLDPFTEVPTLSLVCEIADPLTREPYAKDPRRVAKRAEEFLRSTGVADTCYVGPSASSSSSTSVVYERPERGPLQGRLGRRPLELGRPEPRLHDPREARLLPACAARHAARFTYPHGADARAARHPVRFHHHEVASGGQCEIDLRFQSLARMADQ